MARTAIEMLKARVRCVGSERWCHALGGADRKIGWSLVRTPRYAPCSLLELHKPSYKVCWNCCQSCQAQLIRSSSISPRFFCARREDRPTRAPWLWPVFRHSGSVALPAHAKQAHKASCAAWHDVDIDRSTAPWTPFANVSMSDAGQSTPRMHVRGHSTGRCARSFLWSSATASTHRPALTCVGAAATPRIRCRSDGPGAEEAGCWRRIDGAYTDEHDAEWRRSAAGHICDGFVS